MTPQLPFDTEVLIVGAGPVGLGLAIELGQRGIRCIVVERQVQPLLIPKGQNLTQRTLEHFYFWGAEPALRAARTIPRGYGIGGITAYGNLLSGHAYDWLQRELVRPFYFTDNERLPQYATETVLRHRVSQIKTIETLYGYTVDEIARCLRHAYGGVEARQRAPHASSAVHGRLRRQPIDRSGVGAHHANPVRP